MTRFTILLERNIDAKCWLATFQHSNLVPDGTYPLPFTTDASLEQVFAFMRRKHPRATIELA